MEVKKKMNNFDYFNYSKIHPEEPLDPYYAKNMVVIPYDNLRQNTLTINNAKLLDNITAYGVLLKQGTARDDKKMKKIVEDVINILDTTPNINFSSFSQFFMVYNSNYSLYKGYPIEKKRAFISEMIERYYIERHQMYLSHGYTNSILQVMCDNYSHKRNSKTGIDKVLNLLSPYNFHPLSSQFFLDSDDCYYFLPDKGDSDIFEAFLDKYDIKMVSRQFEQNKNPDIVFKKGDHFYIVELKTMKEGGGGQNKQVVEFALFIKYSEANPNIHYITFLDGNYSNILFHDNAPKVKSQRNDIIKALTDNPSNYFVNTKGLMKFFEERFR